MVITGEQEKMIGYHFFAAIPPGARSMTSRGNEAKADDYATAEGTSLEISACRAMIDDRQAIITTQTSERGSKHAVFETVKYLPKMISIENSKGEKKHN